MVAKLIKLIHLIQDSKTGEIPHHLIKVSSKELTLIKRNNHTLGVGAKVRIYLQKGIAKTYVEVDI